MASLWEQLEVAKPNKLVPVPKALFDKLFTQTRTTPESSQNIVSEPAIPVPKPKPEALTLNLESLISTDASSGCSSGRLSSHEEREEEQQQQRRVRGISSEVMHCRGDCDPDCGEDYCEEKEEHAVAAIAAIAAAF